MGFIVVILALALVGSLAVNAFLWRKFKRRRTRNMAFQDTVKRALDIIRGLPTVLAGAVTAMAAMRAGYDAEIAKLKAQLGDRPDIDLSGLDDASAAAEAAEGEFAKAIAVNTPASDEVHPDDGGTGTSDSGTVVDPADVDTTPVTDPVPEGAEGQAGSGTGGDPAP